jgi:hypothetical protein
MSLLDVVTARKASSSATQRIYLLCTGISRFFPYDCDHIKHVDFVSSWWFVSEESV